MLSKCLQGPCEPVWGREENLYITQRAGPDMTVAARETLSHPHWQIRRKDKGECHKISYRMDSIPQKKEQSGSHLPREAMEREALGDFPELLIG